MARSKRDVGGVTPSLSDSVYRVLGNQRRRHVLSLLAREDEPMDIGTLAERVASLEADSSVEEVSYDQRKSVYTGLYQNHLPLMEQAGLIRSENGWDRIELTDRWYKIQRRVSGGTERSTTREVLFAALPAFVVGLFLGVWFGAPTVLPVVGFVQGLVAGLGLFAVGYVLK